MFILKPVLQCQLFFSELTQQCQLKTECHEGTSLRLCLFCDATHVHGSKTEHGAAHIRFPELDVLLVSTKKVALLPNRQVAPMPSE